MRHYSLTYVTVFLNFDLGETVSKRYWSRADIDGGATLVVTFGTNVCVRPAQLKIGRIFC